MFKDKILVKNTALLTLSSLAMRFVGMVWQVWLAGRIGEAGIGLFQLIMSVAGLAMTLAVSGIRFTTTRLVAEQLGRGSAGNVRAAVGRCVAYGAAFGAMACAVLLLLSERIGFLWLGDARTVAPLQAMALGLPFLAVTTVIFGYFTATGRVWKSVCVQIGRELFMIAVTALLLMGYVRGDIERACRSIAIGGTIADGVALAAAMILFLLDIKKHIAPARSANSAGLTDRMLTIALPLAAASYARSGLSTFQHLLVPRGLRLSGLNATAALSAYGVIQGMSLPVVLFPSCLMMALAELIVPKLTQSQIGGNKREIRQITGDILHKSLLFSLGTAFCFLALGDAFGEALYGSIEAGKYIALFALIVPVMYMDMIADGCLKGLGEMMFCMYVNIADAGLSALLVWLMLPRGGIAAYVFVICFTEAFNFAVSLWRLARVTAFRFRTRRFVRVILSAALAAAGTRAVYRIIETSTGDVTPALVCAVGFFALIYVLLISPEEAAGKRASGKRQNPCW